MPLGSVPPPMVGCTVHAVAVQLVSFCEYERAGVTSEITLLEIPGVLFSEATPASAPFSCCLCNWFPRFVDNHSVTGESRGITGPFKRATARVLFQLKTWGMAEIFLAGGWSVSLN